MIGQLSVCNFYEKANYRDRFFGIFEFINMQYALENWFGGKVRIFSISSQDSGSKLLCLTCRFFNFYENLLYCIYFNFCSYCFAKDT